MTLTADQLDLLAPPRSHRGDPPASRQGAAIKRATQKTDAQLVLAALDGAGVRGCTAHEIDAMYGWASRSGSPAGKRLSELLRLAAKTAEPSPVVRLRHQRNGCHIHVKRDAYDPDIHGETV